MHEQWRSVAAVVSVIPLLSCSVMGLDEFGDGKCTSDADCAKAEPDLRASSCGVAVCQSGLCRWQEGHETCDRKDNDCDGLIDNHLEFSEPGRAPAEAVPGAVAYAPSPDFTKMFVAVAVKGNGQGFAFGPDSVDRPGPSPLQYAYTQDVDCPKLTKDGVRDMGCNFAELALAADDTHLLFAGINRLGCTAGQLRVGLSEFGDGQFTVQLGRGVRAHGEEDSNMEFGVDIDPVLGCTGKSLVAPGAPAPGATRPAVASVSTKANGQGALVVWLAAPANDSDVPPDSIPVEALGLIVPAERPEWLNGTDEGTPQRLGNTTSRSAPAVLALKSPSGSGNYLVAFPAEKDGARGIQLSTVRVSKSELQSADFNFLPVAQADQVSLALG
jgi:hypothetical protein